jgi:hypothetical protein
MQQCLAGAGEEERAASGVWARLAALERPSSAEPRARHRAQSLLDADTALMLAKYNLGTSSSSKSRPDPAAAAISKENLKNA